MTYKECLALEPHATSDSYFCVEGNDPELVFQVEEGTDDTDDMETFEEIPECETAQSNLDTLLDECQPQ